MSVTAYTPYVRQPDVTSQVDFSHYTDEPVDLAVALVNTDQNDSDLLGNPDQLLEFLDEYRDMWENAAKPAKKSELEVIRKLRTALREVITAGDEAAASEKVNRILDAYGAIPRVSVHSGHPHLHFEPMGASMCSWLGATTAMGLASVIVEHGVERFGVCSSGDCDDV